MSTGALPPNASVTVAKFNPIVQVISAISSGSVASVTTAAATTTNGNSFIIAVGGEVASRITAPTDNKGNTYSTGKATGAGGGPGCAIYYCYNAVGGASHTFTFTPSASDFIWIVVLEVPGLQSSPLNQTNGAVTNSTTHASGNITSGTGFELWIGAGGLDSTSEGVPKPVAPFLSALTQNASGSNEGCIVGVRVVGPVTTDQFTWIAASANRESIIAAFKLL